MLTANQFVKANNAIDPVKLQSATSINKAVKNNELSLQQIKQLAKQGKIAPNVLKEFNELQQTECFSSSELEIYEQNYFGVKAKEFLNNSNKFKSYDYKKSKSSEETDSQKYSYKMEEENNEGGSEFGETVANAGDVNNDGYDDVIVGAGINGNGDRSRAYIFYGGQNLDETPDVIMTWEGTTLNANISVSSAGDVNNDGYDDVVAVRSRNVEEIGQADIFFGGENMDNIADVTITKQTINFGCSVSLAGDVNNDGYDDIIIGAKGYSGKGNAYIYYGGLNMDNIEDIILSGENFGDNFGHSVANAGDVNGDGFDDVVVGAIDNSDDTGRAYIFYGDTDMDITADVIMSGEESGNFFGWSVSFAGDVNNDGFDDVIIGANKYLSSTGRAYIFCGGANMDNIADVTITGNATSEQLGRSISGAGDINNDGYDDVIVGAIDYSNVYYGGLSMDNTPDAILTGNSNFGYSVSSGGDINNDGYNDLIVGASGYYSDNRGHTYIYYGNTLISDTPNVTLTGESTYNHFGYSVSSAGDVNNDGYDDAIVGAFSYSNYTGRAYIYLGGSSPDNIADIILTGEGNRGKFGWSVSSAGDVNNDGYDDVIVGAIDNSNAYIYYGGSSMDNSVDVIMTGENGYDYFGCSVSSAGDVNNDGYDDVVVGAYFYSNRTGRAYVYLGGGNMDNNVDVIMTGESSYDYFGRSVSSAGDVNNDGFDDIIIGAEQSYSNSTGLSYIYYGGTSLDNIADIIINGEEPGSKFGGSVSSAGDINNDGYDDVIIGASGYLDHTGRAYVYYGAANMDATADVIITGEEVGSNIGMSVSSAGDMNNDGYDDVIIGGGYFLSNPGYAYLYYGGINMDNLSDRTFSGEINGDFFGRSVANVGNFKGNGNNYLLIGAFNHPANGAAYIYGPEVPTITNQPIDQTGLCSGTNISYTIVAENANNYQWQLSTDNGTTFNDLSDVGLYSNVTAATLNITGLTIGMNNYQFRCVMSNEFGSTTSDPAILSINLVPNNTELPDLSGQCLVQAPTSPTATINCTDVIEGYTTTSFPIEEHGTTVITWIYDDGNGNISTQTQNVVVYDNTLPVPDIQTLPDLTDECEVLEPTYPSATDNCSGIIIGSTTSTFPITEQGTSIITWTYNDGNGNIVTQTQNVIIEDITYPVIQCKESQTINLNAGEELYSVVGNEIDPTISDNCELGNLSNDFNNSASLEGAQLPIGTTAILWTLTDNAGNSSNCSIDVTVNESTTGFERLEESGISIFPNPTNGIVKIKLLNNVPSNLKVVDLTGKQILEKTNIQNAEIFDLSQFRNGTYLLLIEMENQDYIVRIIKE